MRLCALFLLLTALCSPLQGRSPHVGEQARRIKALSEEEVAGYLAGAGMGHALAAELNHHPGPRHVLELASALALTDDQYTRTAALFRAMKEEASNLGARLIEKEQTLDALFASGTVSPETLRVLVDEIGALQARIRHAHLKAHVEQRQILTEEQVQRYDRLRGYTGGGTGHLGHGQNHQGHAHRK